MPQSYRFIYICRDRFPRLSVSSYLNFTFFGERESCHKVTEELVNKQKITPHQSLRDSFPPKGKPNYIMHKQRDSKSCPVNFYYLFSYSAFINE